MIKGHLTEIGDFWKLPAVSERNKLASSLLRGFVEDSMENRIHTQKSEFDISARIVFQVVSGKPSKNLANQLILTFSDSPMCPILNHKNPTSLATKAPELFKMQPTAFYFEMDSSSSLLTLTLNCKKPVVTWGFGFSRIGSGLRALADIRCETAA
jgi:hypothetical protein